MTFDLQESLATSIREGTGLNIKVAYLSPDNEIGLVPTPGSHMVEEDFDGLQYWSYNYAVTISTTSARQAKDNLFKISNYLSDLHVLKSENGSFSFDHIEVSSAPSEIQQDTKLTTMYELDVVVFVYRERG